MATSCKGICEMFKGDDTSMRLKYQEGQKCCSYCEIFLKVIGLRCPCCKTILRIKARNRFSKLRKNNFQ